MHWNKFVNNLLKILKYIPNVCELKYIPIRGGKKYFVTLVNDYTRYCMIYLLASMDETFDKFKS